MRKYLDYMSIGIKEHLAYPSSYMGYVFVKGNLPLHAVLPVERTVHVASKKHHAYCQG